MKHYENVFEGQLLELNLMSEEEKRELLKSMEYKMDTLRMMQPFQLLAIDEIAEHKEKFNEFVESIKEFHSPDSSTADLREFNHYAIFIIKNHTELFQVIME